MTITLNGAETAFADSPQGRAAIARERMKYETGHRWQGRDAAPWNDAMEARAVRALATHHARSAVASAAVLADAARQAPIARAARDAARAVLKEQTRTAYLGNR